MEEFAKREREAILQLASVSTERKNAALMEIAVALEAAKPHILAENTKDMADAQLEVRCFDVYVYILYT